jgi:hypothetical protein
VLHRAALCVALCSTMRRLVLDSALRVAWQSPRITAQSMRNRGGINAQSLRNRCAVALLLLQKLRDHFRITVRSLHNRSVLSLKPPHNRHKSAAQSLHNHCAIDFDRCGIALQSLMYTLCNRFVIAALSLRDRLLNDDCSIAVQSMRNRNGVTLRSLRNRYTVTAQLLCILCRIIV